MKSPSIFVLLVLAAALSSPLSAQTYTFGKESDFADNFTVTSQRNPSLAWDSGGFLREYNATTTAASIAILKTPVATPSFSLLVDARFGYNLGSLAGASVGFVTHVTDASASDIGYLCVFRLATDRAELRIFKGIQADTPAPPSPLTTLTLPGSFASNTYYTFKLDVANTGSKLIFTGSLLDASTHAVIGAFKPFADNNPSNIGASLVGLRLGTVNRTHTDAANFTVTAATIPESSAYAPQTDSPPAPVGK